MSHHNAYLPRRLHIEIEDVLMEDMNQISILIAEGHIADSSDGHGGHDRDGEPDISPLIPPAASHMTLYRGG
jgi:hypothetical protein